MMRLSNGIAENRVFPEVPGASFGGICLIALSMIGIWFWEVAFTVYGRLLMRSIARVDQPREKRDDAPRWLRLPLAEVRPALGHVA
jgi:hypothetical protein